MRKSVSLRMLTATSEDWSGMADVHTKSLADPKFVVSISLFSEEAFVLAIFR